MFGSGSGSPTKDSLETTLASHPASAQPRSASHTGVGSIPNGLDLKAVDEDPSASAARSQSMVTPSSPLDKHSGEKKRRSSGLAKAGALFTNAKNSLHLSGNSNSSSSDGQLNPRGSEASAMQKLGKVDPALSVPQGYLNNSAGDSKPGPRSTFRVGVTEDKNKKCRRTMEDTHAYLYNFLSTPAPNVGSEKDSTSSGKKSDSSTASSLKSLTLADCQINETDNGYFAIFDGHAGTFAADWCGKKLHIVLEELIKKNPNTPIPELLDQTFTSVDRQLDNLPVKNSGCTAICAVLRWEDRIPNPQSATGSTAIAPAAAAAIKEAADTSAGREKKADDPNAPPSARASVAGFASSSPMPKLQSSATRQRVLYTANVGDARIVLCRNGKALRLSYDHKGSDENEGRRISNAGGLILNNRVNGVLAVTRALGDAYMKDLVTGHPYTTETVVQPDIDEFMILACDGVSTDWSPPVRLVLTLSIQLWDVCSDQEATDLIRDTQDVQAASKMLVEHALNRFSTDNLSVMVVRFDGQAVQQNLSKPAQIGVEGDPPSTKKGGISEAEHLVGEATKGIGSPLRSEDELAVKESAKQGVMSEMREEQEEDPGPEVDPEGLKKLPYVNPKGA